MIKVPAVIAKISTMVDGGISLTVHTQELNPEDQSEVFNLHKKLGYFIFAEKSSDITGKEVENLPEIKDEGQKTPSQRLRSRLFVYYTQKLGREKADFNKWYEEQLSKIGQRYLEKIDE